MVKKAKEVETKTSKQIYDEFVESIKGMSKDELLTKEQELIKEMETNDDEVSKVLFDMPEEGYPEAAEAIRYFLNKNKVQWQYTLGLVTLYEFWMADKATKINYPTLDATLRNLGAMEFTGYEEWKRVLTMNTYFEPLRESYIKYTDKTYLLAQKHSALIDALKIYEPVSESHSVEVPSE